MQCSVVAAVVVAAAAAAAAVVTANLAYLRGPPFTGRLRGEVRSEAGPAISTAARGADRGHRGSQREAEVHVQPLLSGEASPLSSSSDGC